METKQCSKCGVEKALCGFSKNKSMKDGHLNRCKDCYKIYYQANKEQISKREKAYKQANKDKIKAYREANKEKKRAYDRKNRAKRAARERERRRKDRAYNLRCLISASVWKALKKQGKTKGGSTFSALPYTPQDLVEHIERQFDETMTWDNYGSYWEIDHIYPQSLLPYDNLDHPNFQKCWDLDNLQPLEKSATRSKSNKVL